MSKSEPTGGWLSRPFEEQDFPAASPGWVQGYNNGELAVREGRNEDKWSKVQPRNCREKSLFLTSSRVRVMLLWSLFYAPEAQKAELDQSLFRKLSPGRLWRLGGFQRLDTSSVFWPRRSQSASAEVPASWSRKSKSASQKNPHQEKLLSSLKEKM